MKVIYDGQEIADVPDCLVSGDTIIIDGCIYEILTKTYDNDLTELYCKVSTYDEKIHVCEMMERIYQSPSFKTSGLNTNNIENNPRLLVLTILMPILIEENNLMKMAVTYRKNAMIQWSEVNIKWHDIFTDDPVAITSNLVKIKRIATSLLKTAKIGQNIWPDGIK